MVAQEMAAAARPGMPPRSAQRTPSFYENGTAQGQEHMVLDLEAVQAAGRLASRYGYRFAKRLFDIVFSLLVLVLLSWLYAVVAIAIKRDSEGPVFFKQERVGKDGKTFKMYKFRSMYVDAEERLKDLQDLNEKDGPVFKIKDDPRITRVGHFIRKTSIDELPQFINVLKGDMSIVGPRPALPREVSQYTPYQRERLLVKPGITCFWQTRRNRDDISFDEWVGLDLLYIKKCSMLTDLKLIVQTVGVVLTAQGN
ncbi:MAG: exopolysaccharide biosynthesis polyprenyl glycosylphosphotransferase [Atopobium sp.]|nr:exopolysaccharide biosynthesis polyprenyl glycosylphosphotransferase [Olegusella sp.]MCC6107475.1 exopolysaccharide biosynthesis polyprenyl glycosylphosphotransferase [Atopobium sp.]